MAPIAHLEKQYNPGPDIKPTASIVLTQAQLLEIAPTLAITSPFTLNPVIADIEEGISGEGLLPNETGSTTETNSGELCNGVDGLTGEDGLIAMDHMMYRWAYILENWGPSNAPYRAECDTDGANNSPDGVHTPRDVMRIIRELGDPDFSGPTVDPDASNRLQASTISEQGGWNPIHSIRVGRSNETRGTIALMRLDNMLSTDTVTILHNGNAQLIGYFSRRMTINGHTYIGVYVEYEGLLEEHQPLFSVAAALGHDRFPILANYWGQGISDDGKLAGNTQFDPYERTFYERFAYLPMVGRQTIAPAH